MKIAFYSMTARENDVEKMRRSRDPYHISCGYGWINIKYQSDGFHPVCLISEKPGGSNLNSLIRDLSPVKGITEGDDGH
jgi:hypothetical protein